MFTIRHLGIALFGLSLMALISLTASKYAPNLSQSFANSATAGPSQPILGWESSSCLRTQVALTLLLGCAGIWIIVEAQRGPDNKTWAYATMALLLGYWLKA
jgi:hypothetical protein